MQKHRQVLTEQQIVYYDYQIWVLEEVEQERRS